MADFTLFIKERVLLEGTERGSDYILTISGIENADNRIVTIPSGSETTIFKYNDAPGAGTFTSSSFKYGRVSNYSTTTTVNLKVSSSSEEDSGCTSGTEFIVTLDVAVAGAVAAAVIPASTPRTRFNLALSSSYDL